MALNRYIYDYFLKVIIILTITATNIDTHNVSISQCAFMKISCIQWFCLSKCGSLFQW